MVLIYLFFFRVKKCERRNYCWKKYQNFYKFIEYRSAHLVLYILLLENENIMRNTIRKALCHIAISIRNDTHIQLYSYTFTCEIYCQLECDKFLSWRNRDSCTGNKWTIKAFMWISCFVPLPRFPRSVLMLSAYRNIYFESNFISFLIHIC